VFLDAPSGLNKEPSKALRSVEQPLPWVETADYLGVTLDTQLTWSWLIVGDNLRTFLLMMEAEIVSETLGFYSQLAQLLREKKVLK
jgi:hypothetical protein